MDDIFKTRDSSGNTCSDNDLLHVSDNTAAIAIKRENGRKTEFKYFSSSRYGGMSSKYSNMDNNQRKRPLIAWIKLLIAIWRGDVIKELIAESEKVEQEAKTLLDGETSWFKKRCDTENE